MRKTYLCLMWAVLLAMLGVPLQANATKSLKVNSSGTKMIAPEGTIIYAQSGNVIKGLAFEVSLTNNGDEDLVPGDENFSLTLQVRYTNIDLLTQPITETIAAGETKVVTVYWGGDEGVDLSVLPEANMQNGKVVYYNNPNVAFSVRENIKRTMVSSVTPVVQICLDTAQFELLPETGTALVTTPTNFSIVGPGESRTVNFRIHSAASRPLTVTALTLPEGYTTTQTFPVTIQSGATAPSIDDTYLTIPITLNPDAPGVYHGDMTFSVEGTDETYSYALTGAKRGEDTYFTGFETQPDGWIFGNNIEITERSSAMATETDTKMLHHKTSGLDYITKAITPKLSFREGDKLVFDARCANSYGNGFPTVKVYYSTDRVNWTTAGTRIYVNNTSTYHEDWTDLFDNISPYPFRQYVTTIPEGQYYVAFEMGYASIDNVAGGKLVEVDYDVFNLSSSAPASMMVNKSGVFAASFKNISGLKGISQDEYEVSFWVNGQKVQESETIDWAPGATHDFEFMYVPHAAGELTAYILFKAGEFELKTQEITVPVTEEVLVAETTLGTPMKMSSANAKAPFYFYYRNATTDIIFPEDYLAKYGITPGTIIKGMSLIGYSQSKKTLNCEIIVKMAPTDATTVATSDPRFDLSDVEPVYTQSGIDLAGGTMAAPIKIIDFTFPKPYTYQGGNLLLQSFNVGATTDVNTYYQYTEELKDNARLRYNDNPNTYETANYNKLSNVPVITFALEVSPGTLTGIVTHNEQPVEGATITLEGPGDVLYTATTDGEGRYNMTVFQTEKEYSMSVTAPSLVTWRSAEPISFEVNDKVADVAMHEYAVISGNVSNIIDGVVKDAVVTYSCGEYTASSVTDEEGNYTLNVYEFAPEATLGVDANAYAYTSRTLDMSAPEDITENFELAAFSNNRDYTITINVQSVVDVKLSELPFTLKSVRFNETYPAKETVLNADGSCTINVYGGPQQLVIKTVGTELTTVDFNVNRDRTLDVLLGEDVQNPKDVKLHIIHDAMTGKNDLLVTWNPDAAATAKPVQRIPARSAANPYEKFIITFDGNKIAETEAYEYLIEGVSGGSHLVTVTAKYATTQSDAVSANAEITNDGYVPVVFTVTNNADANLDGNVINLRGEDGIYNVPIKDARAMIGFLPKGKYEISLNTYGFEPFNAESDLFAPEFVDITLVEHISKPYNLTATAIEREDGLTFDVKADWNQVFGMSDSFEGYEPFATGSFGDWKTIDLNTEPSYPMMWGSKLVTFSGSSQPSDLVSVPPVVFNPAGTTPSMESEPSVAAFDGVQSIIFQGPQSAAADKWLISPVTEVKASYVCSFAAKAYTDYEESLEVCVSTTGDAPEDFKVIETIKPSYEGWNVYSFSLSEYVGREVRIALHCTSLDGFMLQVDDFKISDPTSEQAVDMGNVLRYELSLADLTDSTTETSHTFTSVPGGNHTLAVKAIYASGASEQATYPLNMVSGIDGVGAGTLTGDVTTPEGVVILRDVTIEQVRKLDKGIYIFRGQKVVVK